MITIERPDLNGRVIDADDGRVAIVVNGVIRVVENDMVRYSLFGGKPLASAGPVDGVARGALLNDGSCLVRADGGTEIYLLTGLPQTRRHLISSYEIFQRCGFDLEQVRNIPWLAMQAIPVGATIRS